MDDNVWSVCWHGVKLYNLWVQLCNGTLLESKSFENGHEFTTPGVYCSPRYKTGWEYARAQQFLGGDEFHMGLIKLRVRTARRKREIMKGGLQWVFDSEDVVIESILIKHNCGLVKGTVTFFPDWQSEYEALPPGRKMITTMPIDSLRESPDATFPKYGPLTVCEVGLVRAPRAAQRKQRRRQIRPAAQTRSTLFCR